MDPSFASHLFDGLNYRNKPSLTPFGLNSVRIAYGYELCAGGNIANGPDEATVRKLAQGANPNVPLVLDWEQWNVQGDTPEVAANIDKLVNIVNWVHDANPAVKVGFFGLAPISNAYRELHDAQALADPTIPQAAQMVKEYQDLQRWDAAMGRLASVVDFVCPALYTFKSFAGGDPYYRQIWDIQAANVLHEAQQYGKPVYAFLWPQFFDDKGAGVDHEFIPADFWRHELEHVRDLGAQGAIIWGSATYVKAGWNNADPWWAATRDFLAKPDTLVLQISQDPWVDQAGLQAAHDSHASGHWDFVMDRASLLSGENHGVALDLVHDAQFTVTVDGQQVGGVQTVHASHASGQWDTITLQGAFGSGPEHRVEIVFLSGAAAPGADRKLYVSGAMLDGTVLAGSLQSLSSNGAAVFGQPAPLVQQVSQNTSVSDAQFVPTIDHPQVDAVQPLGPSGTIDIDRHLYAQGPMSYGTALAGGPHMQFFNGSGIIGLD